MSCLSPPTQAGSEKCGGDPKTLMYQHFGCEVLSLAIGKAVFCPVRAREALDIRMLLFGLVCEYGRW
jgi:hypothetical protein